jgi:PAS domain S-box-containing protein
MIKEKVTFKIIMLSFIFGWFYWIIDSIHSYMYFVEKFRFMLFQAPMSLLDSFIFKIPTHDLMARIFFMVSCLLVGILTAKLVKALTKSRLDLLKNIKERDKVQQDLIDSENRLRTFFDAAFEGTAITEEGKFVDGNNSFINMFGYERDEMLGMHVSDFVYSEDKDFVFKNIKENYTEPYEHRCVHKDGSIRYVEVHGRQIEYRGRPVRITAINDITKRKKFEEDLEIAYKKQRQTSKMEAIGNFANGIAHDFNNALQPIVGNCDLILYDMNMDEKSCKVHQKNILSISAAAEVATLLVRRIQSFARQNGNAEILIPLSLPDCIKESFDFLRSIVPQSIEMELNISTKLELIMGNDVTIKQILMNLCKNASQAMTNDEGRISIDMYNEEITEEQSGLPLGKFIRIEVEDNGVGMTPEIMERAFDPYFTTKLDGKGTGIGLSVVDRIVRNYGGFTRLYSEFNVGTRIIIYIPAYFKDGKSIKQNIPPEPVFMGNGQSILLVDDEDLIIEAVTLILRSLNYKVTSFISSIEALQEFRADPTKYDILLTDLTMPKMTGLVLIKEVKKIKSEVKIILCSGLSSNGKYESSLYDNFVDVYIRKPVTRKEYADALKKVV